MNNAYKSMVKEAKSRLRVNGYSHLKELNVQAISGKSYIVNSRIIKGEELYGYYKIVSDLVSKEKIQNAIGALIDEDVYLKLSEDRRERYVFTLGIMFRDLKMLYEKQMIAEKATSE